ncbi:unnamed protein product, partial [Symbiodinium necroappetens]
SDEQNVENLAESDEQNVENLAESDEQNVENLGVFSDEELLETLARSLYQAKSFSMEAMEEVTSLMTPVHARTSRSFSKIKGKDSAVVHLGMFSHGAMSGVMNQTWRKGPHGQLMTGEIRPTWHEVVAFDPKSWHATMRWTGRRVALAAYTTRLVTKAQPETLEDLRTFGFPLPKKPSSMSGFFHLSEEPPQDEVKLEDHEKEEILAVLNEYKEVIHEDPEERKGGFNQVVELGSPGDSQLRMNLERGGAVVTSVSFKEGCDLSTQAGTERTIRFLGELKPQWLVLPERLSPLDAKRCGSTMGVNVWNDSLKSESFGGATKITMEVRQCDVEPSGLDVMVTQAEKEILETMEKKEL